MTRVWNPGGGGTPGRSKFWTPNPQSCIFSHLYALFSFIFLFFPFFRNLGAHPPMSTYEYKWKSQKWTPKSEPVDRFKVIWTSVSNDPHSTYLYMGFKSGRSLEGPNFEPSNQILDFPTQKIDFLVIFTHFSRTPSRFPLFSKSVVPIPPIWAMPLYNQHLLPSSLNLWERFHKSIKF